MKYFLVLIILGLVGLNLGQLNNNQYQGNPGSQRGAEWGTGFQRGQSQAQPQVPNDPYELYPEFGNKEAQNSQSRQSQYHPAVGSSNNNYNVLPQTSVRPQQYWPTERTYQPPQRYPGRTDSYPDYNNNNFFYTTQPPPPVSRYPNCSPSACGCKDNYIPFCATNGLTYRNRCQLDCVQRCNPSIHKRFEGVCPVPHGY